MSYPVVNPRRGNFVTGAAKQRAARESQRGKLLKGMITRARVLAFVLGSAEPVRVKDAAAHIGLTDAGAHAHLTDLVRCGDIARSGVRYTHLQHREVAA